MQKLNVSRLSYIYDGVDMVEELMTHKGGLDITQIRDRYIKKLSKKLLIFFSPKGEINFMASPWLVKSDSNTRTRHL